MYSFALFTPAPESRVDSLQRLQMKFAALIPAEEICHFFKGEDLDFDKKLE
jgi:hypothetical protein